MSDVLLVMYVQSGMFTMTLQWYKMIPFAIGQPNIFVLLNILKTFCMSKFELDCHIPVGLFEPSGLVVKF